MINLLLALQTGAIARLSEGATPAYSIVEQGTSPPYHLIGETSTDNDDSKDQGQFETLTLELHTVYRGGSKADLLARMHDARERITALPLVAEGVLFQKAQFVRSAASRPGPDGVTFIGITVFELIAQPV